MPIFGLCAYASGALIVDRSSRESRKKVFSLCQRRLKEEFRSLQYYPEGTRQRVEKWKTGFYYIAKGAGVPIIMVTLDFGKKQMLASAPYYPTDNIETDFVHFKEFYKDVMGDKKELYNYENIV